MQYPSDNVAVRVSFAPVNIPINKMASVIEGVSINAGYPMEEVTIQAILYECLNEYLQFSLPSLVTAQNICFEHYLDDRFAAIKNIINPPFIDGYPPPNKQWMMFLNAQWAIACAELGRQLIPGVRDLQQHQQEVAEVHMFNTDTWKTGLYVLSGKHYDEVDMEEAGL